MVLEMTVSTSFILSLRCMWACVWSEQNLPGLKDPAVCTWGQVGSCEQRKSCSWDGPHVIVHYVSPGQS